MKAIEQYDPLAIQAIQFNIKNVKKYTSIFTIILSLAVLALTVLMNLDTLYQIWAPRKDLTVTQYKFKQSSDQFSNSPICIVWPANQAVVGLSLYVSNFNKEKGMFVNNSISQGLDISKYQKIKAQIGDQNYECYNMKGLYFDHKDMLIINGIFPAGSSILIGINTLSSVLNEEQMEVTVLNNPSLFNNQYPLYGYITLSQFVLMDRLMINYQPQVRYTIGSVRLIDFIYTVIGKSQIRLSCDQTLTSLSDTYVGVSFTITRSNIASIIGQLLAWRGTILIPIAFILIIFPLVEQTYKLDLIKARFESETLNQMELSFSTLIKCKLATICPSYFHKQNLLNKAMERVEEDLDLIHILQLQSIMKRQRIQFNQIDRDQNIFDCKIEQKDLKIQALLQTEDFLPPVSTTSNFSNGKGNKEQTIFQKAEQKHQPCLKQKIKNFIYNFDETNTPISIWMNKGMGYGSTWSIFSIFSIIAAVIILLLMMGLFNFDTVDSIKYVMAIQPYQKKAILPKSNWAVRVFNPIFPGTPIVTVIDQNNNILDTITMQNSAQCIAMAASVLNPNTDWYCASKDIPISIFDGQIKNLQVAPDFGMSAPEGLVSLGFIEVLIIPNNLIGNPDAQVLQLISGFSWATIFMKKNILLIGNQNQDSGTINLYEEGVSQQGLQFSSRTATSAATTLVFITLDTCYNQINRSLPTYWNLFNNTWGIAIIAFQLVIFRVSRLINLRKKSTHINTDKQEKRSDILNVLFDIDRLSKGVYKEQLRSVGFYYKNKLQTDII